MTKRSQSLRDLAGVNQARIRHVNFNQGEVGDPHCYTRSRCNDVKSAFSTVSPTDRGSYGYVLTDKEVGRRPVIVDAAKRMPVGYRSEQTPARGAQVYPGGALPVPDGRLNGRRRDSCGRW